MGIATSCDIVHSWDSDRRSAWILVSALLAACSAEVADDTCVGCVQSDAGSSANGPSWTLLISDDWSLAPRGETTSDVHTRELDRDIYVGAIRPIATLGTHHMALALNGNEAGFIYASAVDAAAVVFPEGVGLKLAAGSTLGLQYHVYNTGDEPLSGASGIEIVEIAREDVVHAADLLVLGPFGFALPPGQESTATSACTVQRTQTIFALLPHMHQLGTRLETTLTTDGEQTVLYDALYDFDEQAFRSFDPIRLSPGDTITTRCTWWNSRDQVVRWGVSSESEMCFSVLYRYPAGGDDLCTG